MRSRSCTLRSLQIVDGFVQHRFDCGSGEGLVRSDVRVNDGLWHRVSVERNSRKAKLTIDDQHVSEGLAPIGNTVLNLDHNSIYFGGQVTGNDVTSGFVGCLRDISVSGEALPLSGSNSVGVVQMLRGVQLHCRGLYMHGTCRADACLNGGTCQMVGSNQHMCVCGSRFAGARCERDENPCASNPCLNGGKVFTDVSLTIVSPQHSHPLQAPAPTSTATSCARVPTTSKASGARRPTSAAVHPASTVASAANAPRVRSARASGSTVRKQKEA